MYRVLVIDDDSGAALIGSVLSDDRVELLHERDWLAGLRRAARQPAPDLVVLGLKLALAFCSRLRSRRGLPVVVLTDDEERQAMALESLDADDCVAKSAPPRLLRARLRRLLWRARRDILMVGGARLDAKKRLLRAGALSLALTPLKTAILTHLMREDGGVLPARELFRRTHGHWPPRRSCSIKECLSELREALGGHGDLIESRYGEGYRFNVEYARGLVSEGSEPAPPR